MAHRKIQLLAVLLTIFTPTGYARAPKKIIDGENASILDFPYQVFLEIQLRHVLKVCGGAIIDARHILTAAHCVHRNGLLLPTGNFIVITGTDNLQYRPTKNIFRVQTVTPHPNYNRSGQVEDDIAVLKLNRPMSFNDRRKPGELPTEDITEGMEVTITGWGRQAIDEIGLPKPYLQEFKTTVICPTECWMRSSGTSSWKLESTQSCTWSERRGSACKGDSGSPLSFNGVVVGIHSKGTCRSAYPAIFTRVYSYLAWIRSIQAWEIHYSQFLSSAIGR